MLEAVGLRWLDRLHGTPQRGLEPQRHFGENGFVVLGRSMR
jgi:hypothetical protein